MSERVIEMPVNPVDKLRNLVAEIHSENYGNVDTMRDFLILYEEAEKGDDVETLWEKLDLPDLMFTQDVFDDIVTAYDDLGGSPFATYFPETGHVLSSDWNEELETLTSLFSEDSVRFAQSQALYVRQHAKSLKYTDPHQYSALLANPRLLEGVRRVYDFENEDPKELPYDWPDRNDGFIDDVLEAVGYHYLNTYPIDWSYKVEDTERNDIAENFRAIAHLESVRPGATKYLSEQFGIRHFNRYPTELLATQFDAKSTAWKPYGIVISAVDDHNGALRSATGMPRLGTIGKLYAEVKNSHDMFVAEAATGTEFESHLKQFDSLNRDRYKLDFAVIDTHGRPESLTFGRIPHLGSLAIRQKLSDVKELFSARASVLLTGCSSGQINGIAQSLSRQFRTTVIAPQEAAGTQSISFLDDQEGIRLIPEYAKKKNDHIPTPVIYRKGSPLGAQKTAAYLNK
jgi:hypothetical protein